MSELKIRIDTSGFFSRSSQVTKCTKVTYHVFLFSQVSAFKGIEKGSEFLSSQERQSVIYQLLNSIRADKDDQPTEKLKFREGEAIRKFRENHTKTVPFYYVAIIKLFYRIKDEKRRNFW